MKMDGAIAAGFAFAVLFAGMTFGTTGKIVALQESKTARFEVAVKALEDCQAKRDGTECETFEDAVTNLAR